MYSLSDESRGTNTSLLRKISHPSNAPGWAAFYDTYGPMVERFALKFGLNAAEAQDVVQNTMVQVSKTISNFDRTKGSFKSWLFTSARWRIVDALRVRPRNTIDFQRAPYQSGADTSSDVWEPSVTVFEKLWDEEWQDQLKRDALAAARKKVSGVHFQIFCLYVLEGLPAAKVSQMLGVRVAQVHLVRCRVGRLVKKELAALLKQQN